MTINHDAQQHPNAGTEHQRIEALVRARRGPRIAAELERQPLWTRDFTNLRNEWRRLFSELLGTFLLVLAAAGGPVVAATSHQQISRIAQVTAPALTVLAVILFMGAVSGAHLNPIVSVAFALRGDFGWSRVPGYVLAQLAGALLASVFLWVTFGDIAHLARRCPGPAIAPARRSPSKPC
jgi:aquaporin Z